MIQIAPQMRILVAIEATDFRRGIDGLIRVCKEVLKSDPFSGPDGHPKSPTCGHFKIPHLAAQISR